MATKLYIIFFYIPLLILDILIALLTEKCFKDERKKTMEVLKRNWIRS
jgi:hypothetical protein